MALRRTVTKYEKVSKSTKKKHRCVADAAAYRALLLNSNTKTSWRGQRYNLAHCASRVQIALSA